MSARRQRVLRYDEPSSDSSSTKAHAALVERVARLYAETVEQKLVELVERRLGRSPTDDEVREHGSVRINWPEPGWSAWLWDDDVLLAASSGLEDGRFVIKLKVPPPLVNEENDGGDA